jgi:hypothetical protein
MMNNEDKRTDEDIGEKNVDISEKQPDNDAPEAETEKTQNEGTASEAVKESTSEDRMLETETGRVIDEHRPVRSKAEKEQHIIEELENAGLLEDEYDDFDEVYLHSDRKPKKWKKREQRLWVRVLIKLSIFVVVVGALLFAFFYGFRLNSVQITGNYKYTDEEILTLLNYGRYPKNTIIFWWKNKDEIKNPSAFIDKISVSIGGMNTVNVTVTEKYIIGCIDDGGLYMYFDNTGTVLESSTSKSEDVPEITGINISGMEIGDQLDLQDVSVFNNLYELSVLIKNYNVSVDQIEYRPDRTLMMKCGSIQILLGTGTNLEDKINAYKDLESNLEGMSGVLHLEDYDSSKKSIFFSKE